MACGYSQSGGGVVARMGVVQSQMSEYILVVYVLGNLQKGGK